MSCVQMQLNYFVVVLLPSRQIKRVARPTACNYERYAFEALFFGEHDQSMRGVTVTLNCIFYWPDLGLGLAWGRSWSGPGKKATDINARVSYKILTRPMQWDTKLLQLKCAQESYVDKQDLFATVLKNFFHVAVL